MGHKRTSSKTTKGKRRAEWTSGRRNSHTNDDKHFQELRRSSQCGMVGAVDVPVCCFCGSLVPTIDAHFNGFGDVYCVTCGHKRGLIASISVKGTTRGVLAAIDAFGTDRTGTDSLMNGVSTESRPRRRTREEWQRAAALGRFEREIQHEAEVAAEREERRLRKGVIAAEVRAQRHDVAMRRFCGHLRRVISEELEGRLRLFDKAVWWFSRDPSIPKKHVETKAIEVACIGHRAGLELVNEVAIGLTAERHSMAWSGMRQLTNVQAEMIRSRYAEGGVGYAKLGKEFGVTGSTIGGIVTGSLYKQAGGPIHVPKPGRVIYWDELRHRVERRWAVNGVA